MEGPTGQVSKNLGKAGSILIIIRPLKHFHRPLMFSNTVNTVTPLVGNDVKSDAEGSGGESEGGGYGGGAGAEAEAEGPASGMYCRFPDCCWEEAYNSRKPTATPL